MEAIKEGTIIAGRWRVLAVLESDHGSSFRVADESGNDYELLVLKELGNIPARVEALRPLRHDNIIAVVEAGSWGAFNYLVRELVTGQTVREWLDRDGRLYFEQALGIACQLCLVSSEMAKQGVDFLAYNPERIQININGFVKIDPLLLQRDPGDSRYNSHEELRGRQPNQKSDLFRIGMIIHEMLLGRLPSREKSGSTKPENIHTQVKDVPEALDDVVSILLAEDPAERYANTDDLLDRLHPLLMQRPRLVSESGPTKWHEDKRFWLYIALGLGAAVIIIAFLLGFFS